MNRKGSGSEPVCRILVVKIKNMICDSPLFFTDDAASLALACSVKHLDVSAARPSAGGALCSLPHVLFSAENKPDILFLYRRDRTTV